MRVASLVPAASEILRFLGVEPVGVSHCCDWAGKPVLTQSIIPSGLPQHEVDDLVSQAVRSGESLYRVKEELLEALKPDLILTQGVCEVCAVSPSEVNRAVSCMAYGIPSLTLQGTRLGHLWSDLRLVADAVEVDAEERIGILQSRLERVRSAVEQYARPRVAFVEWLEPPFLGGHWVPDLIETAGGHPLGASPEFPSPRVTWEYVADLQPEVLLYSFCGYNLAATLHDLKGFAPALPRPVTAWALDAANFCALTPKVVRGVEILANLLHPQTGGLWEPWAQTEANPVTSWELA